MCARVSFFLAMVGVAACGGRAVEQPGSGGSGSGDPPTTTSAGAGAAPSGSLPMHDLGDCTPGFSRADNPSRPCNWLTQDGACFNEHDDACACVCPSSGDSVCFGPSYGGPGSATLVRCQ